MVDRREFLGLGAGAFLSCASRNGSAPPAPSGAGPAERIFRVAGGAGPLRVSDGGSGGPAFVFVHGLASDLEVWREQLDFVRAIRRAVAYDQRGHGESARAADGAYSIDSLTADLEAVRSALGLDRIVLVGHSVSGEIVTA